MLSPVLFCSVGLLASFLFLSAAEQTGWIGNTTKQGSADNANERCTYDLYASQHTSSFTSPGFPSNYPSSVDCSWVIRASPENRITLRFVSMEVEYERHCQYDYLTIYDGPNTTFPQVGRYCGHITPADFTSSMPIILVEFHSNSADACAWRGFEIQFLVAGDSGCSCGGSGSNGSISGGGDGNTGDVAVDAGSGQDKGALELDVCGIVRAVEASEDDSPEDNYRIVGGTDAKRGSSPWMARLWHLGRVQHLCGGSLINNRWVVTVAQCITELGVSARDIEVRLGDHDSLVIDPGEMTFSVSRIVVYEEYDQMTFDGDIALLELDQQVPVFTDYISPICLPSASLSRKLLKPGKRARIIGWGSINERGAFTQYLQQLQVPIIPQNTCRRLTTSSVTDNMFCAGFSQAAQGDACRGDSGGPLAMKKGDKWYLLGLVSWGEGCDREGKYGFYTKVANFISWMRNTMRVVT